MVWSEIQRTRLAIEKQTLEKYFPNRTTWIDPMATLGGTKVEVLLTSNANYQYTLRIYVPSDFPNHCPNLVVVSPKDLYLHDGRLIPKRSNTFHTLGKKDGFNSICHFRPRAWTGENTLYQVFMKGRLWIEAYEIHLETGKNMDDFLGHMPVPTTDLLNPWMEHDPTDDSLHFSTDDDELFSSDDEEFSDPSLSGRYLEPRTVQQSQQPPSVPRPNNIRYESQRNRVYSSRRMPSNRLQTWPRDNASISPESNNTPTFPLDSPLSSPPQTTNQRSITRRASRPTSRHSASSNTPTLPLDSPLSSPPQTTNQPSPIRRASRPPGAIGIDVFSAFRDQSQPLRLRPATTVARKSKHRH